MSDFDEVLERLVTDPVFQAALRADPEAALRGYRLEPQERALLHEQVDLGDEVDRTVEMRISKSGVFGMVGPVVSAFGLAAVPPPPEATPVLGLASDGPSNDPGDVTLSYGEAHPQAVFGTVDHPVPYVPQGGPPAADYHTWVDADGDGRGDAFRAVERGDGGVDILVDTDGDGRVDFVGHDDDRDALVDVADYDTDGDGVLDTRMDDVDGDGWLDRSRPYPTESYGTFGVSGSGQAT
jgi:hypothetical protein